MNLYRITLRHQHGEIAAYETTAASLLLAVHDQDEQSEVVSVGRIHLSTGEVLGGFYNE